ncbi:MAG: MFS transporter [Acidimicrobiia bacterium]
MTELPWRRLALAILIVALSALPVFLVGATFLQLEQDIALTTTGLGAAAALFFLTASISSAGLGRVVERIGWRASMRINSLTSALILVGIALFARSVVSLSLLMVAGGAVYGLANPSANKALAELVRPERRGLIFGLKHSGIPTSTLLAGLAVPTLALTIGWRFAFAFAALLLPLIWLLLASDNDDPIHLTSDENLTRGATPMSTSQIMALAAAAALATWAAVSLSTFLIAAAVEASLSESGAGLLLFVGSLVSIGTRVTAGALTDRGRSRGFTGLAVLMGVGSLVFFALGGAGGVWFVGLILLAFATGWGWPGLMTFTVVNANIGTPAASSAITQAGVFLGAGLGPLVLGWLIDNVSQAASWATVGVCLSIASIVTLGVARSTRPK